MLWLGSRRGELEIGPTRRRSRAAAARPSGLPGDGGRPAAADRPGPGHLRRRAAARADRPARSVCRSASRGGPSTAIHLSCRTAAASRLARGAGGGAGGGGSLVARRATAATTRRRAALASASPVSSPGRIFTILPLGQRLFNLTSPGQDGEFLIESRWAPTTQGVSAAVRRTLAVFPEAVQARAVHSNPPGLTLLAYAMNAVAPPRVIRPASWSDGLWTNTRPTPPPPLALAGDAIQPAADDRVGPVVILCLQARAAVPLPRRRRGVRDRRHLQPLHGQLHRPAKTPPNC